MIILLTSIAIAITSVPLAAVVIVTAASRREETARSIAGRAPGAMTRTARRLLGFHAVGIRQPASRTADRGRTRRAGRPAARPGARLSRTLVLPQTSALRQAPALAQGAALRADRPASAGRGAADRTADGAAPDDLALAGSGRPRA